MSMKGRWAVLQTHNFVGVSWILGSKLHETRRNQFWKYSKTFKQGLTVYGSSSRRPANLS